MGIYTAQELRRRFTFRLGSQDRFYLNKGKPILYPIRILMGILKQSDREKLIDSYLKDLIIYTEEHQRIAFRDIQQLSINKDLSVSVRCQDGQSHQVFETKHNLGYFPMVLDSDNLAEIQLDHMIGFKDIYSQLWAMQYLPAIGRLSQYIVERYNPQSHKELIDIGTKIDYSISEDEYIRLVDELLLVQAYCRIQLLCKSKNLGQGRANLLLQEMEIKAIEEAMQADAEAQVAVSEDEDKSSRVFIWCNHPEKNVYKIIHLFISLYKSKVYLTPNEFINEVAKEGISTNPYGAVRSLMTNAGNSYGKVFEEFEEGESSLIDFAENLHARRGEIHQLYGFTSALPTVEEIQEEQEERIEVTDENSKDYSQYELKGVGAFNKRNLPLEVIKLAIQKGATAQDIIQLAHNLRSARIGVNLLKSESNWISSDGVKRAYKIEHEGTSLYVSNQWTRAWITNFIDAINSIKEGPFSEISISVTE